MKKRLLILVPLFLSLAVHSAFSQDSSGLLRAEGTGTGASREDALESARLAAATALVVGDLKHDALYKDLFVQEAYREGWFSNGNVERLSDGSFSATSSVEVYEGELDALYMGRYATTVSSLLDKAEQGIAELEAMLSDASTKESNGDLSGADGSYRMAAAKGREIARYLEPIEDAFFFSTSGNRKAPELKALISSYELSAEDGIARVSAGLEKLSVDKTQASVISYLDKLEESLVASEKVAEQTNALATAPRSQERKVLSAAASRVNATIDALILRQRDLQMRIASVDPSFTLALSRGQLLGNRIDVVLTELRSQRKALGSELFARSFPVKAMTSLFSSEPSDRFSLDVTFPWTVVSSDDDFHLGSSPWTLGARLEGAFAVGRGGLWIRTNGDYEFDELATDLQNRALSQSVDLGFFGHGLVGAGFSWDWMRTEGDTSLDTIRAVSVHFGVAGDDLGHQRGASVPLWLLSFLWELPRGESFSAARDLNLRVETLLRPSPGLRLEAQAASRARSDGDGNEYWLLDFGAYAGFGLPILRPLMIRIGWDAQYAAPLDEAPGSSSFISAFRIGASYHL